MRRSRMCHAILANAFFLSASSFASQQTDLTKDEFINQVVQKHLGIAASKRSAEAAALKVGEVEQVFSPRLLGSFTRTVDEKPAANVKTQGDKRTVQGYSLGIQKLTSFGMAAKATFADNHTTLDGTDPIFVPESDYYESSTTFEVSQSLWKNFAGREIKHSQELGKLKLAAESEIENFKTKAIRAQAEATYWRLVLARESIAVTKASVQRSEKIRQWSASRADMQLADRSDLLQAEAIVSARNIEYRMAQDEEEGASRALNSLRGMAGSKVGEKLASITPEMIDGIKIPQRAVLRGDVAAEEKLAEIQAANAELQMEKYKPSVDLFIQYALNGRNTENGEARSGAFSNDDPTMTIGVKFDAPIGGESLSSMQRGYQMDAVSSREKANRKKFEVDQDWTELNEKVEALKERFKLVRSLEELQRNKMEYERGRQQKGRTTTFQVIQGEQDYANAQLNRIRVQAELLSVLAQMQTFGG